LASISPGKGWFDMSVAGCGQHTTLPGNRRRVARGVAAYETFRQNLRGTGVERFDSAYRSKAENHSAGRNARVAELLALFSLLRNLDVYQPTSIVTWGKAQLQAASATGSSNAAHRLPCQIVVDGQLPWKLPKRNHIDMSTIAHKLRALFGDIWGFPKVFNIADSTAEASCLRGSLIDACKSVLANTKLIKREAGVLKRESGMILLTVDEVDNPGVGIDHKATMNAYDVWIQQSVAAFQSAIQKVRKDGRTDNGQDCSADVIYILEQYIQFAAVTPALFANSNAKLYELEESLWRAEPS